MDSMPSMDLCVRRERWVVRLRALPLPLTFACLALVGSGLPTPAAPAPLAPPPPTAASASAAEQFRCIDKTGRYTIEVTQVSLARRFEAWNTRPRTMQVDLALCQSWSSVDPEAALGVTWPQMLTAVDEAGRLLTAIPDPAAPNTVTPFRPTKTDFGWQPAAGAAQFVSPDPGARRIARLSGKAIVWIPGETAEVRIPLTPSVRETTVTKERFRVTLQSAGWEKGSYVAELVLKGPGFWSSPSGLPERVPRMGDDLWPGFFQRATFDLLDSEGNPLGHPLPRAARATGGRGYRLSWDKRNVPAGLKPRELVVRFLAGYGKLEVPFEFENIPLP